MKYSLFVAALFVFVNISAIGGPSSGVAETANVVSCLDATDPEEAFFIETAPHPLQIQQEGIRSGTEPSRYAPLWGPDLLVTDQCVISPSFNIALDYDANGHIYAAVQSCHNGGTDTLFIYQSTDNGYTWNIIFSSWVGSGGMLLDFDMKLEPYTTVDPEIYIIWADSHVTSGYRLFFGAIRPSGIERWHQFTDTVYDSTFQVALDVEPDSNPFIVFSYIRHLSTAGETGWFTCFSADTGLTWASYSHVTTAGPNEVTVSCNDSAVYYAGTIYTQSSNRLRVVRHTLGTWNFDNASSANDTVRQTPNIVTQKYQTYPSNYVYGLYTQGSSQRVYYNYSTDGGENWQTPGIWSISGDNVSYLPNMTLGWDQTIDRPVACCNVPGTGYDTLVVAMMESNFTTWYLRAAVNDHDKTTSMPAKITYGTVSPINGRIVIYREFASNNIWFDRWNHMNQVEETPDDLPFSNGFNVFRSSAGFNICFSTALDQNIRIEIFDVLGRNVVTIADQIFSAGEHTAEWNMTGKSGEKVVSGTYFISITTQTEKATKAIQLF